MSRYIDAEPFEKELKADICFFKEDGNSASALRFSCFLDRVISQPTADVAPVVHAHWTCVNTTENVYMCDGKDGCGNCTILLEGTPKENDMLFCAHCGAKMDEEVKK